MSTNPTLPPAIDYTARDYASTRDALIARIPYLLPTWTSRTSTDFGIVLIELYSYISDVLAHYTDRVASEAQLSTAVLDSSIRGLAAYVGYTPIELASATGTVNITLSNAAAGTGSQTIPAGTKLTTASVAGQTGIIFETAEDLVIDTDGDPYVPTGTVDIIQGETVELELLGESNGTVNQEFALFNTNVVWDSVQVFINAGPGYLEWKLTNELFNSGPGDAHYIVTTDANGATRVRFGDGYNGAVPPFGASITATYRIGDGAAGNVAAGSIVKPLGYLPLVSSVTNPSPTTGGEDRESVESIRANAPKSIYALNRAVNTSDYSSLVLRVPGVGKAHAVSSISTAVTVYVAPEGGGSTISDSLMTSIQDYLENRKMIGTTLTVLPVEYVDIHLGADVYVLDNYQQELVRLAVKDAVKEAFSFTNTSFSQRVTISKMYHTIMGVEGVDYVNLKGADGLYRTDGAAGLSDVDTTDSEMPTITDFDLTMHGGIV